MIKNMSNELPDKNWRKWAKETTDRQGRERGLKDYEGYLGFKGEELKGKIVLDLGSGETELFSRELSQSTPDVKVIALNPDYSAERFRKTMESIPGWQRKSVAAIGQELPFKDEMFDRIYALYSVTAFSSPHLQLGNPEAARQWMSEIVRVLKPGGEARLAPILTSTEEAVRKGDYKELINGLEEQGLEVKVEMIKGEEIGLANADEADASENTYHARIIIRKPANVSD